MGVKSNINGPLSLNLVHPLTHSNPMNPCLIHFMFLSFPCTVSPSQYFHMLYHSIFTTVHLSRNFSNLYFFISLVSLSSFFVFPKGNWLPTIITSLTKGGTASQTEIVNGEDDGEYPTQLTHNHIQKRRRNAASSSEPKLLLDD